MAWEIISRGCFDTEYTRISNIKIQNRDLDTTHPRSLYLKYPTDVEMDTTKIPSQDPA